MIEGAVVKRVPKKPFYDIFIGRGWKARCRVFRDKDGKYYRYAGIQLSEEQINKLMENYKKSN